jgi:hypothetical protein
MQSVEEGRGWPRERLVVLACAIVLSGALRKDVDLVDTDLMVQDPGCLLAGVPDLHVIVQVLRQTNLHFSKINCGEEENSDIYASSQRHIFIK